MFLFLLGGARAASFRASPLGRSAAIGLRRFVRSRSADQLLYSDCITSLQLLIAARPLADSAFPPPDRSLRCCLCLQYLETRKHHPPFEILLRRLTFQAPVLRVPKNDQLLKERLHVAPGWRLVFALFQKCCPEMVTAHGPYFLNAMAKT